MSSYQLKRGLVSTLFVLTLAVFNSNLVNAALLSAGSKVLAEFVENAIKATKGVSPDAATETITSFKKSLADLAADNSEEALKLRKELDELASAGQLSNDQVGSVVNRVLYYTNPANRVGTQVLHTAGVDNALGEVFGIRYTVTDTTGTVLKALQKVADQSIEALKQKARGYNKKAKLMSDTEFEGLFAAITPAEYKALYAYFAVAVEGSDVEKRLAKSLVPTVVGYSSVRDADEVAESVEILFINGSDNLKAAWADMLDEATRAVPGDAGQVIKERTDKFETILAERASKDPETAAAYQELKRKGCFNLAKN